MAERILFQLFTLICAQIMPMPGPTNVPAVPGGYLHEYTITLGGTGQIPATQTNFTILVCANLTLGNGNACATASGLKAAGSGGYVTSSSGYDIVFSSTSCSSPTLMKWEMPVYTGSSGAMEAWVLAPTLSAGGTLYICAGNSAITTFQGGTAGSEWNSSYGAVWHLPNGSSLTAGDSTSNGNNGTVIGATAAAGQIDGGASFSGSSQSISYTAAGPITGAYSNFSMEAWVYPVAWGNEVVVATGSGNPTLLLFNGSGQLQLYSNGSGSSTTLSPALTLNAWNHLVVTNSCNNCANGASFYVNGVAAGTGTAYEAEASTGTGYIGSAFSTFFFNGKLDEVRLVWGTTLSANWITSEYYMESNPASFMTVSLTY